MRLSFRRIRTLLDLSASERVLVVAAAAVRVTLAFALHSLPYRLWSWLFLWAAAGPGTKATGRKRRPGAAAAVALAVDRSTGAGAAQCLERALTGFLLLRVLGEASTLRIGIGRRDGELLAHAWLESDGAVILNGPVDHLAALPAPGAAGANAISLLLTG